VAGPKPRALRKEAPVKLSEMTVTGFLTELASDSPAPGGGSAAALSGAIAASLCEMVSGLTLGRETYKEAWAVMREARAAAGRLGARLQELVDQDAQAFNSVMAARRLPHAAEEQKAARERAIQDATVRSARVPLETLQMLAPLADLAALCAEKGNPGCVTDAGSAAQMIRAGAVAAAWNVRVNLPAVRDAGLKEELGNEAAKVLDGIIRSVARADALVEKRLEEGSRT
jgi:glutamate formiminotransferase/formiminotetrahydrofolate cyclodeaminase